MDSLPDELLCRVFKKLPMIDRARATGVCRKWRRVCKDKQLWTVIDIQPKFALSRAIVKIVRLVGNEHTAVLKIVSFHPNRRPNKSFFNALSNHTWRTVFLTCLHLKVMYLEYVDLENFAADVIPKSVQQMFLKGCFNIPKKLLTACELELLDVEDTYLKPDQLEYTGTEKSLKFLRIRNTYHGNVCNHLSRFTGLTHLDLSNSPDSVTQIDLNDLSGVEELVNLQKLDLSCWILVVRKDEGFHRFFKLLPPSLQLLKVCSLVISEPEEKFFWNQCSWFDVSCLTARGVTVVGCSKHEECTLPSVIPYQRAY